MTKCMICEKWRPDHFVSQLVTSDGVTMADPECARQEIEKVHGVPDYQFSGSSAQRLHADYMKWVSDGEEIIT